MQKGSKMSIKVLPASQFSSELGEGFVIVTDEGLPTEAISQPYTTRSSARRALKRILDAQPVDDDTPEADPTTPVEADPAELIELAPGTLAALSEDIVLDLTNEPTATPIEVREDLAIPGETRPAAEVTEDEVDPALIEDVRSASQAYAAGRTKYTITWREVAIMAAQDGGAKDEVLVEISGTSKAFVKNLRLERYRGPINNAWSKLQAALTEEAKVTSAKPVKSTKKSSTKAAKATARKGTKELVK